MMKKTVYLSFIFMNMSTAKIQSCVTIYIHFLNYIKDQKEKF